MKVKSVLLVITVFLLVGGVSFWLFLKRNKEAIPQPTSSPLLVQPKDGFGKLVQKTPSCLGGSKCLEYIVGVFQGWEEIQNSPDKYLLLASRQTGELLPKVRVILEEASPYGEASLFLSAEIRVEEVGSTGEAILDWSTEKITFEEFGELVQAKDTVKVFLRELTREGKKATDENGYLLAKKVWFVKEK